MGSSVYQINKGVNRSIEFKGLKAQYIWWLGGLVTGLLVVFAVLYIAGLHTLICLGIVGTAGVYGVMKIYAISDRYGAHGMMIKMAKRKIPGVLIVKSRRCWMRTKK